MQQGNPTPITPYRPKWKGTMTDRRRFNNQMHYQSVDRCVNREFGYWKDNFKLWPIFVENGITCNDEADIFFNFEPMKIIDNRTAMHPLFEEEVISQTAARRIIRNREGLIVELPGDGHDTVPRFLGSSIRTPEDWKPVKAERFRLDDPVRKLDLEALKKAYPPERDYPLAVWCGSMIGSVRNLLTLEGMAYAIYDYPDMIEDMVETMCTMVEYALDQLLGEVEFDLAYGWEDIAFKNGPLVSVDFFKSVVLPRYKRIGAKLREAGIDIWSIDCDGDVRPLIPCFLEAGVNCMLPFEVNSAGHPAEVLREYGKDLRIMGGVDKMVLARGPEAIKAYLETLTGWIERGGFIPFCDHRCPPDVKPEYYLYYLDLKEDMFGMK